jgi:hypothetical protein
MTMRIDIPWRRWHGTGVFQPTPIRFPRWSWGAHAWARLRQALVALAVLVTLASGFGLHPHACDARHDHGASAEAGHAHQEHVASRFSGEPAAGLGDDLDPDGCGQCHCQPSATDLPAIAAALTVANQGAELEPPRERLHGDGISHQPDPPPAQG